MWETDDGTSLYAHSFVCALFMMKQYRAPHIRVKLKSVRHEHVTAVRRGKFVLLT